MKNKPVAFGALILVIVAIVLAVVYLPTRQKVAIDPLKIGVDFPLTGNLARYGEWGKRAIEIASEETNASGGVNGLPVQVFFEDNQGEPSKALSAYQKMKSLDGIDAVMTLVSSIALIVQKSAEQDKIVQMDTSASTPAYSTPNDYSFRTGVVATQLAKDAAHILQDKFNAKNIAILSINNDFGKGMVGVFKSSFKGTIVVEQTFNQDGIDFRTQLLNLKKQNVDFIFLVGHIKESGLLVRQARELGIKTPIFSDVYSVEGPEFIQNAGELADGIVYLGIQFDADNKSPEVSKFVTAYRAKYGEDPGVYAAQAYDGIMALIKAYDKCPDNECAKRQLFTTDFQGVSGRIKFDENGDVIKDVVLKTIKDGKFVNY